MLGLITVALTIFLAELGDKTQLATLLFATDSKYSPWLIFIAASTALVASSALAVILGTAAERYLSMLPLKLISGLGFTAIGLFMIVGHVRSGAM
ncbi:MAG: TMEM165/GDT1 family protein [Henriciella sp.]|jgi:putative Ca2+/H+ antiporter (TMEM165/GDT1 family)|nr:TMEM165/GDT1 family protein [Henriciella sp.]